MRRLLTLLSILYFTTNIVAGTVFWQEGKRWIIDRTYPVFTENQLVVFVGGDTIINNTGCKKIYSLDNSSKNQRLIAFGFQIDKKVFCYYPDSDIPELLYDFETDKGDTFAKSDDIVYSVYDIDSVECNGEVFRRWIFQDDAGRKDVGVWIENIGSNSNPLSSFVLPGNYYILNACYIGDNMIYDSSIAKPLPASIKNATSDNQSLPYYYDLQGRRVKSPTKGLYIKNGKKVVVKK